MPENRPSIDKTAAAACIVIPAIIALAQVAYFYCLTRTTGLGFPIDDAYIFKRYAENLSAGNGFAFNPGETSFGCTSILYPLLMAALVKIFFFADYVTTAFLFGGVLFAASAGLAAGTVLRASGSWVLALLAGLVTAGSVPLLMNSISGMETPLTLALLMGLAAAAVSTRPRPLLIGGLIALVSLTRPEGFYFAVGAVVSWAIARALSDKRIKARDLLVVLAPCALLAVPVYAYIYARTGSLLPSTYLGKIVSSNPAMLERGMIERGVHALLSLGSGWMELAKTLRLLTALLALGVVVEVLAALARLRAGKSEAWPSWGMLLVAGYLLLPLAYGLFFPVGPAFGGYYFRYIAPLVAVAAVVGSIGLATLHRTAAARYHWISSPAGLWVPAMAAICAVYLAWLWSFQAKDARAVFCREVGLNTGLRMEAARWIEANTPPETRVLVGYTGLGVVGGNCRRYVLDLGALINPDIIEYYQKAGMNPAGRWEAMVEYMRDRDLDYYVTFALTKEYADKIADPASTAGIGEVARLGTISEFPQTPYEQVRIYRVDWKIWERENNGGNRLEQ